MLFNLCERDGVSEAAATRREDGREICALEVGVRVGVLLWLALAEELGALREDFGFVGQLPAMLKVRERRTGWSVGLGQEKQDEDPGEGGEDHCAKF